MRNPVLVEGAGDGAAVGERLLVLWRRIRTPMVVPLLWALMYACAFMSVMLFAERVYMAIVIVLVKLLRIKRYTKYKLDSMRQEMEAAESHPMVLVQIPMFNEKEVYRLSIGAACAMSWPSNKMIVQVLDDSTDPVIKVMIPAPATEKEPPWQRHAMDDALLTCDACFWLPWSSQEMVEYECQSWASKGVNVEYEFRNSRSGYKAGALREGLEKSYAKDCDFVAIFDADFQPDPDYLWRTIPFLLTNPELALVQARWKFVNADECLLTRLQEMSLDYHFSVEQEVGSSTYSFFGFNGTAGVWRMEALVDAGGWKDRTTVEDMDLAVRASLRGWKFVFVGDLACLQVKNELPSTFKAYRFQQHRWSCGPANLFRKMLKEILCCKRVSAWKKFHVIYDFFFVRKIVAHFVTFFFYCVIIPACVLLPDVHLPKFIAVYIPSATTVLNAICTPRSFHLIIFWILFENVMAMHRAKATIIGLLEANRVYEWIVTAKLGNASRNKNSSRSHRRSRCRIVERIHLMEVLMGLFLLYCTIYDIMFGRDLFYVYLFAQSMAFFVVGFGYVGVYVSN
ncbi:glucomannan 4-beta-mannosyltransferase 1-like isoform X3 [Musa acuminata AAA Group]|uniref:glucomannan 4-beta-mannosyltransferase 1-like isoform X3 n=1 Tax=Musa acuminata AAA Group TaxID=214697 RepID=UPI0031D35CBA